MLALMLMLVLVLELMLMPKEILKIESRLKITPLMEGRCEAEKIGNEDFPFPLARAAAARSHHRFGFDATCNETEWSSVIASSILPPFPSVLCLLLRHRVHSKIEFLDDLVNSGFVSLQPERLVEIFG